MIPLAKALLTLHAWPVLWMSPTLARLRADRSRAYLPLLSSHVAMGTDERVEEPLTLRVTSYISVELAVGARIQWLWLRTRSSATQPEG